MSIPTVGVQPVYCGIDIGALSRWLKWPGLETGYSPPSSAEYKSDRSCNSNPPIRLPGVWTENFHDSRKILN